MLLRRVLILALPFVLGGCATFLSLLEEVGTAMLREYTLSEQGRSSGRSYRGSRGRRQHSGHYRRRYHR